MADALADLPDNVTVETWVDHDELLDEAAVVVCHGGSGTTFGALAAGVPLVMLPRVADQPTNARLVTHAGAGLSLVSGDGSISHNEIDVDEALGWVATAVSQVLDNPQFGAAARRVGDEMADLAPIDELISSLW